MSKLKRVLSLSQCGIFIFFRFDLVYPDFQLEGTRQHERQQAQSEILAHEFSPISFHLTDQTKSAPSISNYFRDAAGGTVPKDMAIKMRNRPRRFRCLSSGPQLGTLLGEVMEP